MFSPHAWGWSRYDERAGHGSRRSPHASGDGPEQKELTRRIAPVLPTSAGIKSSLSFRMSSFPLIARRLQLRRETDQTATARDSVCRNGRAVYHAVAAASSIMVSEIKWSRWYFPMVAHRSFSFVA